MTRPRTTAGKRNVQQHKREKAQEKEQRRAARREADPEPQGGAVVASEAELIDELAKLHVAVQSSQISVQEFEERRAYIGEQLERIGRDGR